MLVHKGGKINNWAGECRDVTPTKSLSQNSVGLGQVVCGGGGGGGGQGGCERRIEVFVKIQKKKWVGEGGGGVRFGGVRVDVIEELKSFWENSQKKKIRGGGGGGGVGRLGGGSQGVCE